MPTITKEDFRKSIAVVQKEFKKDDQSIFILGDNDCDNDIPSISTGITSLDSALGIGGIPRGRIIEIYGPESSGKSTLCLKMISACQKAGGTAVFIDAEHALDPKWAKKMGVDMDMIAIQQPDFGEEALDVLVFLIEQNVCDLVIVDSVPALVPKVILEGTLDKATIGEQARLMSKALSKIATILGKTNTTVVFVNQVRYKIGGFSPYGTPEDTPGGKALKFYSSVRMEIRKRDLIKGEGGKITGLLSKIKVKKNKVAAPFKEAEFRIDYEKGSDPIRDLFDIALEKGIITKKGGWFYFGQFKAHGKDAMIEALDGSEDLRQSIEGSSL